MCSLHFAHHNCVCVATFSAFIPFTTADFISVEVEIGAVTGVCGVEFPLIDTSVELLATLVVVTAVNCFAVPLFVEGTGGFKTTEE